MMYNCTAHGNGAAQDIAKRICEPGLRLDPVEYVFRENKYEISVSRNTDFGGAFDFLRAGAEREIRGGLEFA